MSKVKTPIPTETSVKLPDDFASKIEEIMKVKTDLDDLRNRFNDVEFEFNLQIKLL